MPPEDTEEVKREWLEKKLAPIVAKLRAVKKKYQAEFGDSIFDCDEVESIEGNYLY